jgi:DNA topoisomerase-1
VTVARIIAMTANMLPVETFSAEELATLARLRYVLDEQPGLAREKNGSGFYYLNGDGRRIRDKGLVARIDALAIPPAWTDVWICRAPDGHLQATGRDDRGRKQYIYHERWREVSNLAKFWRLRQCAQFLPEVRRRVASDLGGRELTQRRVLAGMVALLDLTLIRVGNEEYVRQNNSYGLATLRTRHVSFQGRKALLRFRGKSGLRREAVVEEPRLVRLLKQLKKLHGAHVFQFKDADGKTRAADATMVNDYLRELAKTPFTAKDFRTWKASAMAAGIFYANLDIEKIAKRKRVIKESIAAVAEALGNTPTVCRKYYIHAGLMESYLDGNLPKQFWRFKPRRQGRLSRDEQILARYLRRWTPFD